MKLVITFVFLLGSALSLSAQAVCNIAIGDLPEIHGLRLGTPRSEFDILFTSADAQRDQSTRKKPDLTHLEEIWTGFYRERLSAIEFDYNRTTPWNDVRQFAAHLERSLKLPFDSWVFVGETEAMMRCSGFTAAISSVRNTFALTDSFAKLAAQQEARRVSNQSKKTTN